MRAHQQAWTWVLLVAAPFVGTAGLRAGDWPLECHECGEACEPGCRKCVLVPDVRKETHVVYRCKDLGVCLPHRRLCDLFFGHAKSCVQDDACDGCHSCPAETCPQCECRPRRKIVLLKKIDRVECPTSKCEVVSLPGKCSICETYEPGVPEAPAPPFGPASVRSHGETVHGWSSVESPRSLTVTEGEPR